jgi:hypothetical protein
MRKLEISCRVNQDRDELPVQEQTQVESLLATKLASEIVGTLPMTVRREGALGHNGTSAYTYSATAYVFSEVELVTFIDEVKRADRVLQVCDRMLQRFDGIAN